MCVHHTHVWNTQRAEEGTGSPGTSITVVDCGPRFWEWKLVPLQEQPVFLTSTSPVPTLHFCFKLYFLLSLFVCFEIGFHYVSLAVPELAMGLRLASD